MIRSLALALLALLAFSAPASARLVGSYNAFLSRNDHFSSAGVRLTTAAEIIRQDRANYYKFNLRDPQDEPDPYFASIENRDALEQMLDHGRTDPNVEREIVDHEVMIHVDIYRDDDVVSIVVTLLN